MKRFTPRCAGPRLALSAIVSALGVVTARRAHPTNAAALFGQDDITGAVTQYRLGGMSVVFSVP
jgi:hypothetical protein